MHHLAGNEGYFNPAKLDASPEDPKIAPDFYRHRHASPSITAILATDEAGTLQQDATPAICGPDYTFSVSTGMGKCLPPHMAILQPHAVSS